jgi:hypothetical protein
LPDSPPWLLLLLLLLLLPLPAARAATRATGHWVDATPRQSPVSPWLAAARITRWGSRQRPARSASDRPEPPGNAFPPSPTNPPELGLLLLGAGFWPSRSRRTAASKPAKACPAKPCPAKPCAAPPGEPGPSPRSLPLPAALSPRLLRWAAGKQSLRAAWNARTPGAAGAAQRAAAVKKRPRSSEQHASTMARAPGVMP